MKITQKYLRLVFLFVLLSNSLAKGQCTTPTILDIDNTPYTHKVMFTGFNQPGTYYFEYGPAGFTPGTGSSPGAGGTISPINSFFATYGVADVAIVSVPLNVTCYIRLHCNNSSWTPNSAPFNFTLPGALAPPIYPLRLDSTWYSLEFNTPMYPTSYYDLCSSIFIPTGAENRFMFVSPDTSYYELALTYSNTSAPYVAQRLVNNSAPVYTCESVDQSSNNSGTYTDIYYIGPINKGTAYDLILESSYTGYHFISSVVIRCPRPQNITFSNITSNAVTFNWSCSCPDSVILEYGATGFTPGTANVAGTGGTLISPVSSPYTLSGLATFTSYDVYFRSACGGKYSPNKMLRIKTSKNCSAAPSLTCNSFGSFDYAGNLAKRGAWDLNTCGVIDSSEEMIYQITPAITGNYQLSVYNLTSGYTGYAFQARYYLKQATSCNEQGWTCLGSSSYSVPNFVSHNISLGQLTGGTTYYLAIDGNSFTSYRSFHYYFQMQCLSCLPPPQPTAITGPNTFCSGSTAPMTYSVPAVPGAISYNWSKPGGWTGTSTTNSITLTPGGNGYITCSVTNSCGQGPPKSLWVFATTTPPQPSTISGNASVCQGSSQTYSAMPVSGATSYLWTLPAGWNGTSTTTSITVTPSAASGTISVQAVNSCFTGIAQTKSVTVTPIPVQPNSIIGNSSVCANSSNTYSVNSVPGATSYLWTLPSGWSGTSTTNTITVTAGTTGGTLSVKAVNSCGTGIARTATLTIVNPPGMPGSITSPGGNTKVCPGTVKSYSIVPLAMATSYTWTPPPGSTITSGQGTTSVSITYNTGFVATDTLKVTASNACGTGPVRWIKITRDNPATPGTITGTTYGICGINNLPYSVSNVAGITYGWSSGAGTATVQSGQGTNTAVFNFSAAFLVDTIRVTASNACGTSAMRKLTVRKIPAQPGAITGNAGPCMAQQNVPYSITPVPSAATYTWVGPTGSTIFDGVVQSASNTLVTASTSVQVDFGNNAGTVKVRANNLCGSGSYRSLTIAFTCRMAQDETDPAFEIVPNPAKEKADVRFLAAAGTTFRLKLLDISGKLIFEESGQALTGLNIRNLDLRQLTQGIYFVEIILNDRKYSSKLLVE